MPASATAEPLFRPNGVLPGELHVTELGPEGAPRVIFVHGATSWGDDPMAGFAAQRPLAGRFRLLLVDRRGYGDSPDAGERFASDYLADADDLAELLGEGAHLVGHSYGGVGAMIAAARRPEVVRSLTLIEPGCYQAAADDPAVAAALRANRAAYANLPELTPEQWLLSATEPMGLPPLEPTPRRLRAAATVLRERVCWEAGVPLPALRAATFPKLVIAGAWDNVPQSFREQGGTPLMRCAQITAERIGARHVTIPGAGHNVHVEASEQVNALLAEFWG